MQGQIQEETETKKETGIGIKKETKKKSKTGKKTEKERERDKKTERLIILWGKPLLAETRSEGLVQLLFRCISIIGGVRL